jgi:hypothetical protein
MVLPLSAAAAVEVEVLLVVVVSCFAQEKTMSARARTENVLRIMSCLLVDSNARILPPSTLAV